MQFPQSRSQVSAKRVLLFVIALSVAFLLFTSVAGLAQKYFVIRHHIKDLEHEQAVLTEKKDALAAANAYMATPEGQEQKLRNKYNLVKPGEGMIVITNAAGGFPVSNTPAKTGIAQWWDTLLRGLGIRK